MRLTFRRLLAYLDGVLDEQDVEVLGQKISESEFASRLIHRIRNAKTRMRLGAPRLTGTGMGLDPNTVAEYLDYTLNEDRVPDFEKVCLESDVHLAEVSASHEVLTLVLAEPAQVERSIRERMYNLPNEPRRPSVNDSSDQVRVDGSHGENAKQEASAMREMAEYLDERTEVRWRSMLLTMALTFLLVLVGLRAIGKFDHTHPLLGRMLATTANTPVPELPLDAWETPNPDDSPSTKLTPTPGDDNAPPAPELSGPPAPEPGTPPAPQPGGPPAPEPSGPPAPEPVAPPAPEPGGPPAPESGAPGLEPGGPPAPEPSAPPAPDTVPPKESPTPDTLPADNVPPDGPNGADGSTAPTPPPLTPDPVTPLAPTTPPVEVGLYNTPGTVLAHYDSATDTWRRLPARQVLMSGDSLQVPLVYRPQVALMGGLQLTIVGPAQIRMGTPIDGKPFIEVLNGRLLVESVATANVSAVFNLNGQQGTLVLKSADTSVAIEVEGHLSIGKDPVKGIQRMVRLTTDRGHAQWMLTGEKGVDLPQGQSVTAADDTLMAPAAMTSPSWVDARIRDEWDNLLMIASQEAERQFTPDRAIRLTLEELLSHRMVDVQSFGTQSLAYFGDYRPFVQSLRDPKKHSFWTREFLTIRKSLAQNAAAGEMLRKDLDHEFGGDAEVVARMYQLCLGFANEQLKAGQAAKLVADLSHEELSIRVLAFENLRRITGKSKNYDPRTAEPRAIANWSKALDEGELLWKKPPTPFE